MVIKRKFILGTVFEQENLSMAERNILKKKIDILEKSLR